MKRVAFFTAIIAAMCVMMASLATADVPQVINYQGLLTDENGWAVDDGDYQITFTIYDAVTGGNVKWTSGQQTVLVTDGLFTYQLGSAAQLPDDLFEDTLRWLGIKVGADLEISPRTKLTSVPYAYHALSGGGWIDDGTVVRLIDNTDNVGIGTTDPHASLNVYEGYTSMWKHDFTQAIDHAGFLITTDWQFFNRFTPGVFWSTQNNNATKPKAGIYLKEASSGTYMYFGTSNNLFTGITNDAIVIDPDGNVGIGTANPAAKLHDNGSIYTLGGSGDANLDGSVNIVDVTSILSYLSQTILLSEEQYAEADLDGDGRVTHDDLAILNWILGFPSPLTKEEAWRRVHSSYGAMNTVSGDIFYVRDPVGIGTVVPTEKLDVDGTARLRNMPQGGSANVWVDGTGVLHEVVSSRRYKKNIRELDVDPHQVLQLEPVRFQWKETGAEDIGLIAEDVDQVIPDLVIYDSDGRPNAVKYDRVAIYLLETVRQQQTLIEELKSELNELCQKKTAEIETLKAQMAQMQALVETILAQQSGGTDELAITK